MAKESPPSNTGKMPFEVICTMFVSFACRATSLCATSRMSVFAGRRPYRLIERRAASAAR